jgi:hypothetical protein
MSTPVRRALYGRMAGDTTLDGMLAPPPEGWRHSIYHNQAPQTAKFPLVVFSKSSGNPTETFGEPSAYETDVWLIKAVDEAESGDVAEAVAERIKNLLNDAPLSISGASLMYLRRETDVEYVELVESQQYFHVGAQYRLIFE